MADLNKIAYYSPLRLENIYLKNHVSFSVAAFPATQTYTILHGLGYRPYVKAYYTFGDGKYFDLYSGPESYNINGNAAQIENSYADTTNFYVTIANYGGSAISGTIYYRIYAEPQV